MTHDQFRWWRVLVVKKATEQYQQQGMWTGDAGTPTGNAARVKPLGPPCGTKWAFKK